MALRRAGDGGRGRTARPTRTPGGRRRVPLRRGVVVFGALALVAGLMTPATAYPRPGVTELASVAVEGAAANSSSLFSGASLALAYARPGATERISVASDGSEGNKDSFSWRPSISANGRFVAFDSDAFNLVPGDHNGVSDVFVHDRQTGTTELVSVSSDGSEADEQSWRPSISADGRYVAFQSDATNLVPDDTNAAWDVFVHDRQTGTTERVSVGPGRSQGNDRSWRPSVSADGRYVTFHSDATNLAPGSEDNDGWTAVFVHDRETGTTEVIPGGSGGGPEAVLGGPSLSPSISADGRYVAFRGESSQSLAPLESGVRVPLYIDIYVHDRDTGATELISGGEAGPEAGAFSGDPSISADGRYVAFESTAQTLVPGDTNGFPHAMNQGRDVFVFDRVTATTERVSVSSVGTEGNDWSLSASISADGRYVAFFSYASNLVAGDANGTADVFVHDRTLRTTERVSVSSAGAEGSGGSDEASISADGRHVVFQSTASDLAPGDTNGRRDVFVRHRGPGAGVGDLEASASADRVHASGWATFSGAELSWASDPEGDAAPLAETAGADLIGGRLLYRHEQADLLVRLSLAGIPSGGAAPVTYGMRFAVEGVTFEARMSTEGGSLMRCAPGCTHVASLSGSVGTTGDEVLIAVPTDAVGSAPGATLTGVRAFTLLGPGQSEADTVQLPDGEVPGASVSLGIAPAGTSADDVEYRTDAAVDSGLFSGTLEASAFQAGEYDVWARACLGEACGTGRVRLALGSGP